MYVHRKKKEAKRKAIVETKMCFLSMNINIFFQLSS